MTYMAWHLPASLGMVAKLHTAHSLGAGGTDVTQAFSAAQLLVLECSKCCCTPHLSEVLIEFEL